MAISYTEPQGEFWSCYPGLLCTDCDLRADVLSWGSECFQPGYTSATISRSLVGHNANGSGCPGPACIRYAFFADHGLSHRDADNDRLGHYWPGLWLFRRFDR